MTLALTCAGAGADPLSVIRCRLVYGVAQYSNDFTANSLFTATDFPDNLRGSWNAVFGYIVHNQIAPVMVVEFGTGYESFDS